MEKCQDISAQKLMVSRLKLKPKGHRDFFTPDGFCWIPKYRKPYVYTFASGQKSASCQNKKVFELL